MGGMNYLQFAFFGAILALLASGTTLRILAIVFIVYYASFFVRYSNILTAREPRVELFVPIFGEIAMDSTRFWNVMQGLELVPLVVVFILPYPYVVAWCCAVMTFLGYQIVLAFVYQDLFRRSKTP
jgi:hypothetical protein